MFLLEAIDSLHQGAYNYCKVSRMLLEVAALFGALTFIFYLVKLYVSLIFGELLPHSPALDGYISGSINHLQNSFEHAFGIQA